MINQPQFDTQLSSITSQNINIIDEHNRQRVDKKDRNAKTGRWNYEEQLHNQQTLQKKQFRRSSKIFKLMASIITTRRADQCRSHHQKMQKKNNTIKKIISFCQQQLSNLKTKKYNRPSLSPQPSSEQPTTNNPSILLQQQKLRLSYSHPSLLTNINIQQAQKQQSCYFNQHINIERDLFDSLCQEALDFIS